MTRDTNAEELTNMMVGHPVKLNIERTEPVNPRPRIEVKDLIVRNEEGTTKLDHVSFTANSGEILGIAGIAGSGQKRTAGSDCRASTCRFWQHQLHRGRRHACGTDWERPADHPEHGRFALLRAGGSPGHGLGRQHGLIRQHDAAHVPQRGTRSSPTARARAESRKTWSRSWKSRRRA